MESITRTFTIKQAAHELGCRPSWLRDQVTARQVPHGRWGVSKGVFFTAGHLDQILADRMQVVASKPSRCAPLAGAPQPKPSDPIAVPAVFARLRTARQQ